MSASTQSNKRKITEEPELNDGPSKETIIQILNAISRINGNQKKPMSPVNVVLAGAQSTAKSSTINALSGSRTCPTSMGTCTKFPLKYIVQKNHQEITTERFILTLPRAHPQEYDSLDQVQKTIDQYQQEMSRISYSEVGSLLVESRDVIPMVIYDLPGAVEGDDDRAMAAACMKLDGKENDIVIINTSPKDFDLRTDRTLTTILRTLKDGKAYKKKILINITQIDKLFSREFDKVRKNVIADLVSKAEAFLTTYEGLDILFSVCQTFYMSESKSLEEVAKAERKTLESEDFMTLRLAKKDDKPLFLFGIPAINAFIWNGIVASLNDAYVKLVEDETKAREDELNARLEKVNVVHLPNHMAKELSTRVDNRPQISQMQMELESFIMEHLITTTDEIYKNHRDSKTVPLPSHENVPRISWSISSVRKQDRDAQDVEKHDLFAKKIFTSLQMSSESILRGTLQIVDEYISKAFFPYKEFPKFHAWLMSTYEKEFKFHPTNFKRQELISSINHAIACQIASLDVNPPKAFNAVLWKNDYAIVRERENNPIISMLVDTLHEIFPHVVRSIMTDVTLLTVKSYALFLNSTMAHSNQAIAETSEEEKQRLELEKDAIKKQKMALASIKEVVVASCAKKQKGNESGFWSKIFGV